jgi:hypothetical protein
MTDAATRVRHSEALEPFVLAIDIGSTASRGDVFDASGRPLKGGRVKVSHHFTTGGDGTSEIDPDAVVGEVEQILNEFANRPVAGRIGGVALDTFASSLVGVTKDRRARTPCFTYADSRCAHQVMQLRRELDKLEVQQRTGCRLHTSYWRPDFAGCVRRSRTHFVSYVTGCRWESTSGCGCYGLRRPEPRPRAGPETAVPVTGTPSCSAPAAYLSSSSQRSAIQTADPRC